MPSKREKDRKKSRVYYDKLSLVKRKAKAKRSNTKRTTKHAHETPNTRATRKAHEAALRKTRRANMSEAERAAVSARRKAARDAKRNVKQEEERSKRAAEPPPDPNSLAELFAPVLEAEARALKARAAEARALTPLSESSHREQPRRQSSPL